MGYPFETTPIYLVEVSMIPEQDGYQKEAERLLKRSAALIYESRIRNDTVEGILDQIDKPSVEVDWERIII